jgi:hypothetical protein
MQPVFIGAFRRGRAQLQHQTKNSQIFKNYLTSPISGVRIAAQIVLAQRKEHKRIDKAQKDIRNILPIVVGIAYLFSCTNRKWKYVQYKVQACYRSAIFDPP